MIYEAALKQRTEEIYRENNICVIIPVYNKEKLIGPILDSIPDYIFRIYVIDDASTDRTPEIIRKCAEKDTRITHIRHEINKGAGASIKSGYREALRESMDIAVVMAGDNQMDPKYLPAFLDPIIKRKADYAVGNRLQAPQLQKRYFPVEIFWECNSYPAHKDRKRLLAADGPAESVYSDFKESPGTHRSEYHLSPGTGIPMTFWYD